jgi:transmembrane sensor
MAGYSIFEPLFIKYLNGDLNQDEIRFIESHFSPKDRKEIIDQLLKKQWQNKHIDGQPETYRQLLDKIHRKIEHAPVKKHHPIIDYWYYSKMAASFLIFITVILFFALNYQPPQKDVPAPAKIAQKSTTFGQKLSMVLPDGSAVVLNSGTTLRYPEYFSNDNRQVELEGEAYFEVIQDAEKPFIVKSKHMEVKVLGTSFNFNTAHSIVALIVGKVHIADGKSHVVLSPGQMAKKSALTAQFEINPFDYTQQVGWKDGVINIEGYTVKEVIEKLEKWYGVHIEVRNVDIQKQFSGKLSHKNLQNILEGLSYVLNCKYKINDKNVELYGS